MEGVQKERLEKKVDGLNRSKYMDIFSMYNFRYDQDLRIGKKACRRIPCAYLTCLEILKKTWYIDLYEKKQRRYWFNERCIYWRNFKEYNNWRVVDLVTTNVTSTEEEKVYEIILYGIEVRINERILIWTFGAMRTNDKAA